MTSRQRIELEQSERREAVNGLLAQDNLSEEDRSKLAEHTKRLQELEVELRAAIVAEGEQTREAPVSPLTPEQRELADLRGRVSLGQYIANAAEGRAAEGAEAEYSQALELRANEIPLRLFAPPVEMRTTTSANNTERPRRWIDRLFAGSQARYLGVTFDSVPVGQATYTVTTAGGTPAMRAKEQAAADASWTIGTTTMEPKRLSVHYSFTIEDTARIPGLEQALRRDMRMAMTERMDHAVFNGDDGATGTDADITGFFDAAGTVERTLTQANKLLYPETLATLAALLDGRAAERLEDLRIVSSVPYNTLLLSTSANANRNETLAQVLRANGLSWRSRADVDDATTAGKRLAAVGLANGITGAAVAAMWPGVSMIRDMYTGAKSGQVQLTMHALWDLAFPRASNFAKLMAVA